jgi:hypothetical protein
MDVQTLRLRRDSHHPDHAAPERDGYGFRTLQHLGISRLKQTACSAIVRTDAGQSRGSCDENGLALS